jgi:hypothetical protein
MILVIISVTFLNFSLLDLLQYLPHELPKFWCAVPQKPLAAFLYFLLSNASRKKQFNQRPSMKMVVFVFFAIVEDWAVQVDENNECESRANILSCQKKYEFLNPHLASDWKVVYHSEEHSTAIIIFTSLLEL